MRSMVLGLCVAAALPAIGGAQQDSTASRQSLPADVRFQVVTRWNGPNVVRGAGRIEIEAGREVAGNVAVSGGPLVVAGHVTGSVLALNADVTLRPSARIEPLPNNGSSVGIFFISATTALPSATLFKAATALR